MWLSASVRVVVCMVVGYLYTPVSLHSQNAILDSVQGLLRQLPDDNTRIAQCIGEARKSDAVVAAIYIDEGKALAQKHRDTLSYAKLISEEAIQANIQGRHLLGRVQRGQLAGPHA